MKAKDNKFLAEQMGLCWHVPVSVSDDMCCVCAKCKEQYIEDTEESYDFSTEADWTKAILWAQDDSRHEEWTWYDFIDWTMHKFDWGDEEDVQIGADYQRWLFTPATFAEVLVEFLRGRGK